MTLSLVINVNVFQKIHHSKAEKGNESSVLFITSHILSNYFPSKKLLKANTAASSKRIQTFQKTVTLMKG